MNDDASNRAVPNLRLADPARAPARILRVNAAGIFDAAPGAMRVAFSPGSILLELGKPVDGDLADVRTVAACRVVAVGTPAAVDAHPAAQGADLETVDLPDRVLIPGMVNAHTHLDLTHIGAVEHDPEGGFSTFVDRVRAGRLPDGAALADSVRLGIERSLRGGVIAVGDIAGAPMGVPSLTPYKTLMASGLAGVSFLEFFAVGRGEAQGIEHLVGALDVWRVHGGTNEGKAVRLGIQPHAPYSVMPGGYLKAIDEAVKGGSGDGVRLPLATHLAETAQEREFVERATGRQREFLERIGVWDDGVLRQVGQGRRPVGHLLPLLRKAPFVCVHLNDVDEREIEGLAEARAMAVYCPRSSEYFRAEEAFEPHRYRDLMRAGVPVALGTDSVMNLPVDSERFGVLDEMRLLYRRDGEIGRAHV